LNRLGVAMVGASGQRIMITLVLGGLDQDNLDRCSTISACLCAVAAYLLFAALGFNLGVAAVGLHRAMTQPED
jgi:hypothetical protein